MTEQKEHFSKLGFKGSVIRFYGGTGTKKQKAKASFDFFGWQLNLQTIKYAIIAVLIVVSVGLSLFISQQTIKPQGVLSTDEILKIKQFPPP